MTLGVRRRSQFIEPIAVRSAQLKVDGYWPERNDEPMYRVDGWVRPDDIPWLIDQLAALGREDGRDA